MGASREEVSRMGNRLLREGFGRSAPPKKEAPPKDKELQDLSPEELVGAMREAHDREAALIEEIELRFSQEESPAGEEEGSDDA